VRILLGDRGWAVRVDGFNDVEFTAFAATASQRVKLQIGGHSFTATTDDALELARQLVEAVHEVEARDG
jgi:hypothetical protein